MYNISKSTMLLRTGVDLPTGLGVATEEFREGWSFVRTGNAKRLERKIHARGWCFMKVANAVMRSGVGETAQQATASALRLVLRPVKECFSAVEIEHVGLTQYPWFFLVRIRVYPYLIQRDIVVPARVDAEPLPFVSQQVRSSLYVPDFPFCSPVPQLKQMLVLSQGSESSAP